MSGNKCRNCGSIDIETDPARGDAVCTECGFVLEDQLIVSETTFEESPSGNMMVLGQFVANDSTGGATGFGAAYHVSGKESRGITLQNARKGITHLCMQLQLNQHCIDISVNFYKMALSRQLTRGRKQAHNHAACVYITCRTEGTAHLLIDISDVLQICVHELGRTYLRFTQALCINIPSVDPCLYIMRFANKLEFGEKTHEVSMTALRVVQRMKRDSIHSGRKPSGLCGAALLMAARLHEFNRSPADIVKIVKVHESTLRKRLMEFGDTPSSALTLEEFMTVDLEEEQDPPAFKAARKKDRERLQKLENIDSEINEFQAEIDRQIDEQKVGKGKKRKDGPYLESDYADRFIKETNLNIIKGCIDYEHVDSDVEEELLERNNDTLFTGLGPDIASMGLNGTKETTRESKDKIETNFENFSGEIDSADIDDDELDDYIMTEKEAEFKDTLWKKVNAKYLTEQQEKEERRKKEKEEGKPEKKRRRTTKRNKNQGPATTAGEAIEKMLQEKRISSKINYEVLKSLNVNGPSNQQQKEEEKSPCKSKIEIKMEIKSSGTSVSLSKNVGISLSQETRPLKSNKRRKVEITSPKELEESVEEDMAPPTPPALDASNVVDEAEDYIDDAIDDPTEMTVGQMLGRHTTNDDDDDYGYGYEEEDY
ncbi:transcription factor IIIB 90 kDa subunit-like [Vespa mandarinia]|uniref:transcription factor IIIB 90 kDa subunit-like n=1 Tax=Vespa mandarinia TaxID=7446 RepID=UPI0016070F18|nr:transcription factor IIIB 90 kDa subunit-like [Vespa mandarinia]XP_035739774.1 transcription factor IIIB 90 kDa subunit-like [Vespa mandarinia]XP_035739775.1 transcription factor IIIB 90 kDa subunit-like [Vespa mandarinia]XP_035739776.1 transcription factor IIIB 90 kDa subunit-like [Vespa mandarinia]XP_035739777.1 transcription factor IIIB 90 kDa subunit-like [Vespa mandarinia]XP_035739778.1 transcription factor IIIB 90 kDa subunit-like [Vespa mandarinia]XP_035739779.1 transcription factor